MIHICHKCYQKKKRENKKSDSHLKQLRYLLHLSQELLFNLNRYLLSYFEVENIQYVNLEFSRLKKKRQPSRLLESSSEKIPNPHQQEQFIVVMRESEVDEKFKNQKIR